MVAAERERRKEIEEREQPRSANYVARLVDLSSEACDISKPFATSSEKLNVTPEAYRVLDKVSTVDSTLYWLTQEKDGKSDYDSQMRTFTDSWVNAIKTEYNRGQRQIDSMGEAERRRHEGSLEILDRLGLNAADLDASNIQQFYDRYFRNGRNTSQFVTDMQRLFTKDQIKQNIDTIRFVAEMFDTETAADIAGILLLEAEADKKGFVEKANHQARVTNKAERDRLTKLSRYRHPVKAGIKSKQDVLRVEEEPQIAVLNGHKELEKTEDGISIGEDDPDVKVLDPKIEIGDMQKRIAERRAGESVRDPAEDSVNIHDAFRSGQGDRNAQSRPEVKWDVPLRIPGLKFGEALPLSEKPLPENSRLVGDDNDQLKIVVSESVLSRASEDLRTRSWDSGRFIEQAGFFIGRVNSNPDGVLWSEVLEYVPAKGAIDQSGGHFTINADVWRNLRDELDKMRMLRGDQNLIAIGWAHTHPRGWEGKMSTADETINESFDVPGQFAYVFGAGQGQHIPLEIRGNKLTDDHSFFSKGGSGREFGSYKKHTGIRLVPDTVKI